MPKWTQSTRLCLMQEQLNCDNGPKARDSAVPSMLIQRHHCHNDLILIQQLRVYGSAPLTTLWSSNIRAQSQISTAGRDKNTALQKAAEYPVLHLAARMFCRLHAAPLTVLQAACAVSTGSAMLRLITNPRFLLEH